MPKKGPPPPRRPRPGILRQRGFQQCSRSRRIRRASLLARPTMFGLCEISTISSTAQQGTNLRRNRITYLCRGPQKRHRTTKTRVVAAGNVAAPWSPRRRWEGRRRREARGTEGSRPVRTGKLPAFAGGRLWSEAVGDDSVANAAGNSSWGRGRGKEARPRRQEPGREGEPFLFWRLAPSHGARRLEGGEGRSRARPTESGTPDGRGTRNRVANGERQGELSQSLSLPLD